MATRILLAELANWNDFDYTKSAMCKFKIIIDVNILREFSTSLRSIRCCCAFYYRF